MQLGDNDPKPASTRAKGLMISIQFPETITAKCTHTGGNFKSISFLLSLLAFIEASAVQHSSSWMPPSKLTHFQKTPSLHFTTFIHNSCLCFALLHQPLTASYVCNLMASHARICRPHTMDKMHVLDAT